MHILNIVTQFGSLAFFIGAYMWSASLREQRLVSRIERMEKQLRHVAVTVAAIPLRQQQPLRARSVA
jgi:hypothetical protein